MTAVVYYVYVLGLLLGIAVALVGSAAGLVIAAALVNWIVCALATGVGNLIARLAPTSPLPRATASFHPGDRP